MKKLVLIVICLGILLVSCSKVEENQTDDENTTPNVTEDDEELNEIDWNIDIDRPKKQIESQEEFLKIVEKFKDSYSQNKALEKFTYKETHEENKDLIENANSYKQIIIYDGQKQAVYENVIGKSGSYKTVERFYHYNEEGIYQYDYLSKECSVFKLSDDEEKVSKLWKNINNSYQRYPQELFVQNYHSGIISYSIKFNIDENTKLYYLKVYSDKDGQLYLEQYTEIGAKTYEKTIYYFEDYMFKSYEYIKMNKGKKMVVTKRELVSDSSIKFPNEKLFKFV